MSYIAKVRFLMSNPEAQTSDQHKHGLITPHKMALSLHSNLLGWYSVCGLPPEYCEFGSHLTKCKAWLEEEHPDLFEKYYGEGKWFHRFIELHLINSYMLVSIRCIIQETRHLISGSPKQIGARHREKGEEGRSKSWCWSKEKTGQQSDNQANWTEQEEICYRYTWLGGIWSVCLLPIQIITDLGLTLMSPLPLWSRHTLALGIDLKKAAKQFATKFATGASVSKNAQGLDEIVVQGDVTDEIVEMLEGNVGVLKGVPEDNIVCVEDKKKKGGAEQWLRLTDSSCRS
jgi:hypothetical protein